MSPARAFSAAASEMARQDVAPVFHDGSGANAAIFV